tara:strand:+ start:44 stop:199 length:156 start_codon:yes stop_codon:yes gene_type:complete
MSKELIKTLKKFASSPVGKMKHNSTGFSELDKMIDEEAERIHNALTLEEEE